MEASGSNGGSGNQSASDNGMAFLDELQALSPIVGEAKGKATLPGQPYPASHPLCRDRVRNARGMIESIPGYQRTPLRRLEAGEKAAGLGAIYYKDEATRFGLGSFKSLGGAYAVLKQVEELGSREITVTAATGGNHGRSVSFGAQVAGVSCVIFIHRDVSEGRAEAMRSLGARVIRFDGNYDETFRFALSEAQENGWHVVSDTAYPGYHDIPLDIMTGYGVMVEEIAEQLNSEDTTSLQAISHVFLQAGCGGMAGAVIAAIINHTGTQRPRFILVEPENAGCVLASVQAGEMRSVSGRLTTLMGGLACGEVSEVAWPVIQDYGDFVLTLRDEAIGPTMRALGNGTLSSTAIEGGESGVAGLVGALAAASDRRLRRTLGLDAASEVLVIGSEGATDPVLYEQLTGLKPRDSRVEFGRP